MKNFMKKIVALLIMVLTLAVNLLACGNNAKNKEIIEKLQLFTNVDTEESLYEFEDGNGRILKYTSANEFVIFDEPAVYNVFSYFFDAGDIGNDGEFSYDLSENEIRIYVDVEIPEGSLSIVNYNIDKDEYELNVNTDRYKASDEFVEYMDELGVIEILLSDIADFEDELNENGLTLDDIASLKYKDIESYMK